MPEKKIFFTPIFLSPIFHILPAKISYARFGICNRIIFGNFEVSRISSPERKVQFQIENLDKTTTLFLL